MPIPHPYGERGGKNTERIAEKRRDEGEDNLVIRGNKIEEFTPHTQRQCSSTADA